jgi:hypothetical protein
MTPDEWPNRRLDDLATQVRMMAALATQVATHEAKISGHDDDVAALAKALSDAQARTERMLEGIGQTCERHTSVVRDEVRKLGEKTDELAGAQKFTSAQKTTMITTGIAALATLVATVLTGGPT